MCPFLFFPHPHPQVRGGHQNVLRFWGYVYDETMPLHDMKIVVEYAKHGSLLHFLCDHREANGHDTPLPEVVAARFAMQIACGMQFLEQIKLVHRYGSDHYQVPHANRPNLRWICSLFPHKGPYPATFQQLGIGFLCGNTEQSQRKLGRFA